MTDAAPEYVAATTDAELALAPARLAQEPRIEKLLEDANFEQKGDPGIWWKTITIDGVPTDVEVDIMVPEHFAPAGGRRSVRLPPHDKMIARKAIGLEGSILDHDLLEVAALDDADSRQFIIRVAGPAALIVAKVYELRDRLVDDKLDRIADKDAADVYRLMLAFALREFLRRLRPVMNDEPACPVCRQAIELMEQLFGSRGADGVRIDAIQLDVVYPTGRQRARCRSHPLRSRQRHRRGRRPGSREGLVRAPGRSRASPPSGRAAKPAA